MEASPDQLADSRAGIPSCADPISGCPFCRSQKARFRYHCSPPPTLGRRASSVRTPVLAGRVQADGRASPSLRTLRGHRLGFLCFWFVYLFVDEPYLESEFQRGHLWRGCQFQSFRPIGLWTLCRRSRFLRPVWPLTRELPDWPGEQTCDSSSV